MSGSQTPRKKGCNSSECSWTILNSTLVHILECNLQPELQRDLQRDLHRHSRERALQRINCDHRPSTGAGCCWQRSAGSERKIEGGGAAPCPGARCRRGPPGTAWSGARRWRKRCAGCGGTARSASARSLRGPRTCRALGYRAPGKRNSGFRLWDWRGLGVRALIKLCGCRMPPQTARLACAIILEHGVHGPQGLRYHIRARSAWTARLQAFEALRS